MIGLCENTLRKSYGEEIAVGATKANAKVIESLFCKATGDGQGAVTAAIFWAKTRCGWKETSVSEISGPDGGPIRSVTLSASDELARWIAQYAERRGDVVALESIVDRRGGEGS